VAPGALKAFNRIVVESLAQLAEARWPQWLRTRLTRRTAFVLYFSFG